MSFYNTTKETGPKLEKLEKKAESQEVAVFAIYKASKTGLTAWEVYRKYPSRNTPITSIRRAITNLKDAKLLVKTSIKRPGMYGSPETEFQLYTGQLNLF